MSNSQLLDYIKKQLAQGFSKEVIQQNLISAGGWNLSDIAEAFSELGISKDTSDINKDKIVTKKFNKSSLVIIAVIVILVVMGVKIYLGNKGIKVQELPTVSSQEESQPVVPISVETSLPSCVKDVNEGHFVEGSNKYYSIRPYFNISASESDCDVYYVGTYATETSPHDWYYDDVIVRNNIEVTSRQSGRTIGGVSIIDKKIAYISMLPSLGKSQVIWGDFVGKSYDTIFGHFDAGKYVKDIESLENKPVYVAGDAKLQGSDEAGGDIVVVWWNKEVKRLKNLVFVDGLNLSGDIVSFDAVDTNSSKNIKSFEEIKANTKKYSINIRTGNVTIEKSATDNKSSCVSPYGYDNTKKCFVTQKSEGNFFVIYKNNTWGPYKYVQDIIVIDGKLTYLAAEQVNTNLYSDGKQISDSTVNVWSFEKIGKEIAYFGTENKSKKMVVVDKGIKSSEYSGKIVNLFDVRGKPAFLVEDKNESFIVFNGVEQKHYPKIDYFKIGMLGGKLFYTVEYPSKGFESKAMAVYEQ